MKGKLVPIILAVVVFVAAFALLQPAPSETVVVAAYDLPAGRVLREEDVVLRALPAEAIPPDALSDTTLAVGQPINLDRGQGDVIRESQLGEVIQLLPNERAIAVEVNDPSGLSGLLAPGMQVGVLATISQDNYDGSSGSFTKATIEGVRVMYIDPTFEANSPDVVVPEVTQSPLEGNTTDERAREGTVILAVPIEMQSILYDYSSLGGISETRRVNTLELLAGLGATDSATLTLYLMPGEESAQFSSPGLYLPDLIRTPEPTPTPSPTPTLSPAAIALTAQATPAP